MEEFENITEEIDNFSEVVFSAFDGEAIRPQEEIDEKELGRWKNLSAKIEVIYGTTSLKIHELASITEDTIIPLDQGADELCDILINGQQIAKGRIVTKEGRLGVQIVTKNAKSAII